MGTVLLDSETHANRPLVLVVDDDPAIRHMVAGFLRLEGFNTLEAGDADEALMQADANSPEAVILDITMPGMDGYEVCKKLRENAKTNRVVIVMLSSRNAGDSRVQGLNIGADDYVTKPFDPQELLARLQAHLRRMSAQQEKETILERLAGKLASMNKRLAEEAATDGLTGLYNRRYLWKRFEEEYQRAKRFKHKLCFVLIDIDHFKGINDRYGHPAGDKVLKEMGKIFRSHLRGIDLAARYGGEEFAIFLPETSIENALHVAERLRQAFHALKISPIPEGGLSLSAGIAEFPTHAQTPQAIYKKADEALYKAKSSGRNRVFSSG